MSAMGSAGGLEEHGMRSELDLQREGGNPPGERPLEGFLTDWLVTRSAAGKQESARRPAEHRIPLPIRLTSDQLLDLADETELRALTLEWMTRSFQVAVQSPQTEEALLQITTQLRRMAERLRSEDWRESA